MINCLVTLIPNNLDTDNFKTIGMQMQLDFYKNSTFQPTYYY